MVLMVGKVKHEKLNELEKEKWEELNIKSLIDYIELVYKVSSDESEKIRKVLKDLVNLVNLEIEKEKDELMKKVNIEKPLNISIKDIERVKREIERLKRDYNYKYNEIEKIRVNDLELYINYEIYSKFKDKIKNNAFWDEDKKAWIFKDENKLKEIWEEIKKIKDEKMKELEKIKNEIDKKENELNKIYDDIKSRMYIKIKESNLIDMSNGHYKFIIYRVYSKFKEDLLLLIDHINNSLMKKAYDLKSFIVYDESMGVYYIDYIDFVIYR
ncbi:MAG: hypothetical protein ACP5GJ_02425 [Nanopusillaceae archaeon]